MESGIADCEGMADAIRLLVGLYVELGPQISFRRLMEPYGTLSLSIPDGIACGVRCAGWNSEVDFL